MATQSPQERAVAGPGSLRADESATFVLSFLGTERKRVLDAGCGDGRLVARLAAAGHDVVGVETDDRAVHAAWSAHLPVEEIDFLVFDGGPFDAVVFGASLHHMQPLEAAVNKAAWLLVSDGLVILDEFDLEAADAATTSWFYDIQELLESTDILAASGEEPDDDRPPLERWCAQHHRDERPLSSGREMAVALRRRFNLVEEFHAPYLYSYLLDRLEPSPRGRRVAEQVLQLEKRRIASGQISPVGLRLVARRM